MSDLKTELSSKVKPQWKVSIPCVKTSPGYADTYPIITYYVQADTASKAIRKALEWLPSHYEPDGDETAESFIPIPIVPSFEPRVSRGPYGIIRRKERDDDTFDRSTFTRVFG
jgi:hypothetical protein